jgi:hypothetical protein
MTFSIGQAVVRIEDRPQVAATVLKIEESWDDDNLELAYEEGGTGWWPASAVAPAPAADPAEEA